MAHIGMKSDSAVGIAHAAVLQTRLDENDKLKRLHRERLGVIEGIVNDMASLAWEIDSLQEIQKDLEARYAKAYKRHSILVDEKYDSLDPQAQQNLCPGIQHGIDVDQLSIAFCGIDERIADARSIVQFLEIDVERMTDLVERAEQRLRYMSDILESVREELEDVRQDIADGEAKVLRSC
ncbi:hypothetical protein PENSPDRAFT_692438 [Peniophora sp. CONT]|nr:hypothetical protein PENSPDRAFT_692438 [Peniophora sp. CONT]